MIDHRPAASGLRPPVIGLMLLGAGTAGHVYVPMATVTPWPFNLFGLLLIVGGWWLAAAAKSAFRRIDTPVDPFGTPTRLVEEGPFAYSRNPMYLGVTTVLVGIGILAGTVPILIAAGAFGLILAVAFVPMEEAKLERELGERYRDYCARVRRWL